MESLCSSSMVIYHDLETDRPHRYWVMVPGAAHEFVMEEFLAEIAENISLPRPYKFPAEDIEYLVLQMSLVYPGGVFSLAKILEHMNAC